MKSKDRYKELPVKGGSALTDRSVDIYEIMELIISVEL